MVYRNIDDVRLYDRPGREIRFRNFSGKEDKFNPIGRRSVTLQLDPELAKNLKADGWNIRERERDDDIEYYLQVFINYNNPRNRPDIKMVRQPDLRGVSVDETNIDILDGAEIERFDVRITPYQWEVNNKTGVKAFVKSMNVVLEQDDIANKYLNLQEDTPDEMPFL